MTENSAFKSAVAAQIKAADPKANSWISANAGSGKTRVLTNRVARLLLHDTEPQKILCLTYTKAAAGEMQNRLFAQLGHWSMLDDDALCKQLEEMGEVGEALSSEALTQARRLFAQALETPGGLKIQTIHAFCDAILRRFSIEAGISPNFTVLEDSEARELRRQIVDRLAVEDAENFNDLATHLTDGDLDRLTQAILSRRDAFSIAPDPDKFGCDPERLNQLSKEAATSPVLTELAGLFATGGKREKAKAPELKAAVETKDQFDRSSKLSEIFIKRDGFEAHSWYPAVGTINANVHLQDDIEKLRATLAARKKLVLARESYQRSLVLHGFANRFIAEFERAKSDRTALDYDDLIRKTCALLEKSEMAEWVLFRLDGGIEQILVDEAQDTSPAQWQVIDRLRSEFSAGIGQGDKKRTIFVVGDEKQSIYSFQGADAEIFDAKRLHLQAELEGQEDRLNETPLDFSFRSAPAILDLVDRVFEGAAGSGFAKAPKHFSPSPNKFGQVELWPFYEKADGVEHPAWFEPVASAQAEKHERILARDIAQYVEKRLRDGSAKAGDFLILFRSRGKLFHEILKALKDAQLPVSGADRLKVGQHIAVKDILSLLKFAAQPDDDLSLAECLKSPLCGWDEHTLYYLSVGRGKKPLYQVLRENDNHAKVVEFLQDIRGHVDRLRPFELIERVLVHHRGFQKLTGRLGAETRDALQALLDQSLHYETVEAPTLTGFLNWFEKNEVEVKRQFPEEADQINLMTIHGAKGLERRIVILPDTHEPGQNSFNRPRLAQANGQILWRTSKEQASPIQLEADEEAKKRAREEAMRVLYVALTRAEHELIIAGAGARHKDEADWYGLLSHAMSDLGGEEVDGRWIYKSGSEAETEVAEKSAPPERLPDFFNLNAPRPENRKSTLSPSKLGGEKAISSHEGDVEGDPMMRGSFIHFTLELLGKGVVEEMAVQKARHAFPKLIETEALEERAKEVFDTHRQIFDQGLSEVTLTAPSQKHGRNILGDIDRLVVEDRKVTAVDFKSNQIVPERAEDVPSGILAQMGAYLHALKQVFQGFEIEIAVLWTEENRYMSIPHNFAIEAFENTAAS